MPEAPGVNLLARIPKEMCLTPLGKVCLLSGTDTIVLLCRKWVTLT